VSGWQSAIKPYRPVLSVLLAVLTSTSLTLMALSWFGRWHLHQRGLRLARGFQQELSRRGLLVPPVLRT